MSEEWFVAIDPVRPFVVQIVTPDGRGTGFLLHADDPNENWVIATAAHVVRYAFEWEQAIRIVHDESEESLLLHHEDRAIVMDTDQDTAAILLGQDALALPSESPPLLAPNHTIRTGVDIAWLGYPAISHSTRCFFGGKISAYLEEEKSYLVDGVAINGVSGGPAFYLDEGVATIMGVVSAYVPNRATGEALPGLAVVRSIDHLNEVVAGYTSVDEAKVEEGDAEE